MKHSKNLSFTKTVSENNESTRGKWKKGSMQINLIPVDRIRGKFLMTCLKLFDMTSIGRLHHTHTFTVN